MSSPERIVALSDAVVSGIAAGEVVERPASVVKELVENALDAGASTVTVEYDERPRSRLVVSDDGCGIPADQLALAVARHATSKIRSLEDLTGVRTFGFRGEALASIAAVSDFEIVSRTADAQVGTALRVRHGETIGRSTASARRGTRVTVADLFANVPARRKFLKSPAAEYSLAADTLRRIALAEPAVGFRLLRNGKTVLDAPPVSDTQVRIAQVYGRDVAAAMIPVDGRHAGMRLHGAISLAGTSYGSARRMSMFVNGRWVHDRLLFRAVMEAYRTYLMRGRYPAAVVFLEVDPKILDVNVHPTKREVRFSDGAAVERFVIEAIREALRRRSSPLGRWGLQEHELRAAGRRRSRPGVVGAPAPSWSPAEAPAERWSVRPAAGGDRRAGNLASEDEIRGGTRERTVAEPPAELPLGCEAIPRVVGQVFSGYIVCEDGDDLLLVDQHALHERVLFERLMADLEAGAVSSQRLLAPVAVPVGAEGVEAVERLAADLERAGWEIDVFGEEEALVRAVPSIVSGADPKAVAERVVADMVAGADGGRFGERVMATVACHAAVRVGQRLDAAAATALLEQAREVAFSACCPHGRPVARRLPRARIERLFGR
ncbi:MAG: DNA mismatch repair endonuclease MutL [Deltaproteobacteria bacterium]|nr:MAG: DNA mismatch repair endonuclease MutL [Deltaproteobacteria bacterium]